MFFNYCFSCWVLSIKVFVIIYYLSINECVRFVFIGYFDFIFSFVCKVLLSFFKILSNVVK